MYRADRLILLRDALVRMPSSDAEIFERHRSRLRDLAYGMLGRRSRAADVVQDAYLRWRTVDADGVDDPAAYLTTVVTRLCLDEQKSARQRREAYTGPWLPEPRVTDPNPAEAMEQADALSMALLVLLETLSPHQRAVYVLREVLDRPYAQIARILDTTEAHTRKIAQRARDRLEAQDVPPSGPPEAYEDVLDSFLAALKNEDAEQLAALLAPDTTHLSDGGGNVVAALRPIEGRDRVVRFLLGIRSKVPEDLRIERCSVNGRPGFVVLFGEEVQGVWAFHVADGQIQQTYTVMNPEKLRHVAVDGSV